MHLKERIWPLLFIPGVLLCVTWYVSVMLWYGLRNWLQTKMARAQTSTS
ncbi:MAG: hypothetical protein AAB515_03455 [Patescibacteria group bacterium]